MDVLTKQSQDTFAKRLNVCFNPNFNGCADKTWGENDIFDDDTFCFNPNFNGCADKTSESCKGREL